MQDRCRNRRWGRVGPIKVTAVRGPRLSSATVLFGSGYKPGDVLKK